MAGVIPDLNRVPAAPIVAVIEVYLNEGGDRVGDGVYEPGAVTALASRTDMRVDTLTKILAGKTQTIDFDLADRLLCAASMNDLWLTDLKDIYLNVKLADGVKQHTASSATGARVCARAGCSNRFVPPARCPRKKYCSATCKSTAWKHRKHGLKTRIRGKNRVLETLVCRNGHERTKENTAFNKRGTRYCLICHRASEARWRDRQRAKAA